MAKLRIPIVTTVGGYLSRLRFPVLFGLAAMALGIDLVIPDGLPFVDEIALALATGLFGSWKRERARRKPGDGSGSGPSAAAGPGAGPVIDV